MSTPDTPAPEDGAPEVDAASLWTASRYSQARGALAFYRIMAYLTGSFLLLLVVEMILKYAFRVDLVVGGFNVFSAVAITHGWVYVVYLIADFRLWQLMRWPVKNFLLIALGGVVPLLSFIVEKRMYARASKELDDAVVIAPRNL